MKQIASETKETAKLIGTLGLALALLIGALCGISWFSGWLTCSAKWRHSGLAISYGPIQGCLVQRKDGMWVPASAIRELDP